MLCVMCDFLRGVRNGNCVRKEDVMPPPLERKKMLFT